MHFVVVFLLWEIKKYLLKSLTIKKQNFVIASACEMCNRTRNRNTYLPVVEISPSACYASDASSLNTVLAWRWGQIIQRKSWLVKESNRLIFLKDNEFFTTICKSSVTLVYHNNRSMQDSAIAKSILWFEGHWRVPKKNSR